MKFNVNSLKGRVLFLALFFILLFTTYSIYILYQTYTIKKTFYILSKNAEPSITLTFVALFNFGASLSTINEYASKNDTTGYYEGISKNITSSKGLVEQIEKYCDTLGISNNKNIYDSVMVNIDSFYKSMYKQVCLIQNKKMSIEARAKLDSTIKANYVNDVHPKYWKLNNSMFEYLHSFREIKENINAELSNRIANILITITILVLSAIAISILLLLNTNKFINNSINKIISHIKKVSVGQLIILQDNSKNEAAEVISATNILAHNLQNASEFASHIGKGDFNFDFKPSSEHDVLGKSLVTMRNELQSFKIEDDQRFWVNQGFAKFGEVLRTYNNDLSLLSEKFVSELVKYLDANQGTLFVLNNETENEYLELTACYAYSKKKFLDEKVEIGDGLVGQVYLEGEYVYLTDIPEDYIKITSGLGEALPTSVLIMPAKIEDVVLGVIEIASFDELPQYKIDFINKLGEDLASVLQNVRNNEKTKMLVSQLQERSEQMNSQEEELRQNMEELIATQEEMIRKEKEYIDEIESLKIEVKKLKSS